MPKIDVCETKQNKMSIEIDIIIAHKPWRTHHIEPQIQLWIEKTLAHIKFSKPAEICVKLSSDHETQELNATYRGKDKPTNVLSFPSPQMPGNISLGDIVLAYETIAREAHEQEKTFHDHLAHLIVHGTLHLLGYDHELESDAIIMESLEQEILKAFNIEDPYQ